MKPIEDVLRGDYYSHTFEKSLATQAQKWVPYLSHHQFNIFFSLFFPCKIPKSFIVQIMSIEL